ncbi:NrsF family protein [Erythrobacter sp. EC-HK427]|uniref:NrsF family protein n=1 Tax=Erythrobacter sp. EC-HK427 TaxID=2038396 RepID=UPI001255302F|nr:DUF1109 domain-containing protein [Erythrobacter sp. EC-HK427]VVT14051.1 conserved membrane hypothetical protein [Erythrobacter sp. EC-HK427]
MTDLEALIDRLADSGAQRDPRHAVRFFALLLGAVVLGGAATALVLEDAFASVTLYGVGPIAVKWGFSFTLLLLAGAALFVLGQPGKPGKAAMIALAVPFVPVVALLAFEVSMRGFVADGATWRSCLAAMTIISPPAFGLAVLAMRSLAPVNLRQAGLVAGLFGGAVAMTAYAPFCPELGMGYMTAFYVAPILAMAAIGWLTGPRLLRW